MGNRNCAKLGAVPLGAAASPRRKHDFRPEFLPELTAVQNYCRLPGFTNVEPVPQAGLPCARATTSWPGPSPPCAGPQLLVRARAAPPRSAAGTAPRAPLWALRVSIFLERNMLARKKHPAASEGNASSRASTRRPTVCFGPVFCVKHEFQRSKNGISVISSLRTVWFPFNQRV